MKVPTLLITLGVLGAASSAAPTSQCDVQCCQSVHLPTDSTVAPLLGALGVVVQDMSTQVGLTCSPIFQGGSCSANPVCCENNSFNGVVAIGCTPVDLST